MARDGKEQPLHEIRHRGPQYFTARKEGGDLGGVQGEARRGGRGPWTHEDRLRWHGAVRGRGALCVGGDRDYEPLGGGARLEVDALLGVVQDSQGVPRSGEETLEHGEGYALRGHKS